MWEKSADLSNERHRETTGEELRASILRAKAFREKGKDL
jgi:hypothetical protein